MLLAVLPNQFKRRSLGADRQPGIPVGASGLGMGFTWQMAPHYFLKRAWVLEESFGTGDRHALELSTALEADLQRTVAP